MSENGDRVEEVELPVRVGQRGLERVDAEAGEAEIATAPRDQVRVVVASVKRGLRECVPMAHDTTAAATEVQDRLEAIERGTVASE